MLEPDEPRGDFPLTGMPVHQVAIVAVGMRLIDKAHLERLAQTCAGLNRWRPRLAERRATRRARIASMAPSRVFASPVASPD